MAQGGITTGGNTQRPIIVTGKVAMADGQRLPEKAELELVCQTRVQPQGKTDRDGAFSVELGRDRHVGQSDASVGSAAGGAGFGGALSGQSQLDGASVASLMGCGLRAVLRNYRSEMFDLSRVRVGDTTDAGTLVLRNFAAATELTVSATSLKAPGSARQSLQKSRELIARGQLAEAEKELRKAVQAYPEYAEAWQELGIVLHAQKKAAEARQAFQKSIACDPAYARGYLSLARLSAVEQNWQDAAQQSEAVLKLDPNAYPLAYYYHAVAHYNLNNADKALESAKRAIELDPQHTVPLAEQLLGVILSGRGDYQGAAEQFRNYIRHAPPGTNLEPVKALLADAEKRIR